MRNLLVLSALAAALLATAAARPAPACGFYSPRVFIITAQHAPHKGERTFALADYGFAIAVSGNHVDLAFAGLEGRASTAADVAWLADNKIAWADASVEHLGAIDTFSAWVDDHEQTVVRREGILVGQYAGRPIGRLDADGVQFLLIEHDGVVRSIYI